MADQFHQIKQAYELVDFSVEAVLSASAKKGAKCVCGPGCATCCSQPIPLTPAELLLLKRHISENFSLQKLSLLLQRCASFAGKEPVARPCPMLLDGVCQVYDVRPIACRRYLVSGHKCEVGEDPVAHRPFDMIIPSRHALDAALLSLYSWHVGHCQKNGDMPCHKTDQEKLSWMRKITTIIQTEDWPQFFREQIKAKSAS